MSLVTRNQLWFWVKKLREALQERKKAIFVQRTYNILQIETISRNKLGQRQSQTPFSRAF